MFLEHVNITVSDLDRSIAFYCDLLDLEVRWRGTAATSEGTVRAGPRPKRIHLVELPSQ